MLLGVAAFAIFGSQGIQPASTTLPRLLNDAVPYPVMLLGLAAIIGAVTSSFSASILSAGAMFSWNIYRPLLAPDAAAQAVTRMVRGAIVCLGIAAIVLALRVRSVAALWLFTGDLVFVLLFPQLVMALYDRRANLIGSIAGFLTSLVLRLGGGMSIETDDGLIGFTALIPYAEIFSGWLPGPTTDWYDAVGATTFPVRTLAMIAGLLVIPLVSRVARYREVRMDE
jgi:high affinity choline transporter 7